MCEDLQQINEFNFNGVNLGYRDAINYYMPSRSLKSYLQHRRHVIYIVDVFVEIAIVVNKRLIADHCSASVD